MELEDLFLYLTASQQLDLLDLIQVKIVLLGYDECNGSFLPDTHLPPLHASLDRELVEVREASFFISQK